MSPKTMEPLARKIFKGVLVLEVLGVFGVFGLYQKMKMSQDFRSTMKRRFPAVLEIYYQSNERAGVFGIRESDDEAWEAAKQD